jgi:acyl transferase domain-containing protein
MTEMTEQDLEQYWGDSSIAVIGMAGAFPGAGSVDEFWERLRRGEETISFFSDEELLEAGVSRELIDHPHYVRARGVLEGADLFDAEFFGFTPRDAEIMNPQHRLLLEFSWQALENAGYDSERFAGPIGVFAGGGLNLYLLDVCMTNGEASDGALAWQSGLLNWHDSLTTHVSYKLNLRGPSIDVQSFCSTSLVAVHLACQSLLSGECDMALAGGVKAVLPQHIGYIYQEGGIAPPDGHCRAFDAQAMGTPSGSGVGIVVLKRLAEALADGDHIHAVIRGTAINNDGSEKVGFTAPGVNGQATVIAEALSVAGVTAESLSYVEAHGTGTPLGDPIEIAALTKAFSASTRKKQFCAVGSVKSNVGHLDAAAGVTGLIKTILALRQGEIPPTLHVREPNPKMDFPNTPFYVNTELRSWPAGGSRRAGVSSFGIGGTNVHAILEAAPEIVAAADGDWRLLSLSARSPAALAAATTRLARHLKEYPQLRLTDVAHTLHVGRRQFAHRYALVCSDLKDAARTLESTDPQRMLAGVTKQGETPVAFMFSGSGSQYPNMGRGLYESEPIFREEVDRCLKVLNPLLDFDLRDVLFPRGDRLESATRLMDETSYMLPSLFVVEYALARLLMKRGVRPSAVIGHSFGEYVAACVAGVFSVEDAIQLVTIRARLMQSVPAGAMLAVPLGAEELRPLFGDELEIAAFNGPRLCVVSGPAQEVNALESRLAARQLETTRLHMNTAAHSKALDPVLGPFREAARKLTFHAPTMPYVSNLTGKWVMADEVCDPEYWVNHLRYPVRFSDGLEELVKEENVILLEVGPGRTLCTLAQQHPARSTGEPNIPTLRHPQDNEPDISFLLKAVARLWLAGAEIDWEAFYAGQGARRVPLPAYPFERQRYIVESNRSIAGPQSSAPANDSRVHSSSLSKAALDDWFYLPVWKQSPPAAPDTNARTSSWLVFDEGTGFGERLASGLAAKGHEVFRVLRGDGFAQVARNVYALDPRRPDDYDLLLDELRSAGGLPSRVVHAWSLTRAAAIETNAGSISETLDSGFYSLLYLTRALAARNVVEGVRFEVLTQEVQDVSGDEVLSPEQATILGPATVVRQEYNNILCRSIDVVLPAPGTSEEKRLLTQLQSEFASEHTEHPVAYRGPHRWTRVFERVSVGKSAVHGTSLRERGVYLITGGLGRVGSSLAEHLAREWHARLVLVARTALPDREEWEEWLAAHDESDAVSRRIRLVQSLERLGSEVLVMSADVTDEDAMREVLSQADARFGGLNGVIHAVKGSGRSSYLIPDTNPEEAQVYFRPKALGAVVLERVLRGRDLDFCLLISTISSVLGGLGLSSVAATNIFLDTFARRQSRHSLARWVSVNWDVWRFEEDAAQQSSGKSFADLGITPAEGAAVFERVVAADAPLQVVVSTGDLQVRIAQWVSLNFKAEAKQGGDSKSSHPRPQLSSVFVAPTNEVEQTIAEVWQDLLGFEQVGVYDNFFELGGQSLLATQVTSCLRERCHVGLPLRAIFEHPTIAELATIIESTLVEELERLSEQQAEDLLQQEVGEERLA